MVPRFHSYCILLPTCEDILRRGEPRKYSRHVPESKGEDKPERQLYPWEEGNLVGMAALLAIEFSCYLATL